MKSPSLAETPVGATKLMYVNALVAVAVPPGVVTATSCAPSVPAGATAVILVDETTFTLVAATPATVTLVAPVKFVPVIVIAVPPRVVPENGLTLDIVGAKTTTYVNAFTLLKVPPDVSTLTIFAPAVPVGVVAVIDVAVLVNTVALTSPTFTVAPVKFVPPIVIVVPPVVGPLEGLTLEISG